MRSLSASALAEGAKGAALTVALALVFAFIPIVSIAVVPLFPLPAAYVGMRHGVWPALVAAVAASILAGVISGIGSGLFVFGLAGIAGVALGVALRRNWGFSRLLLVTGLAACLGIGLCFAGIWVLTGMTMGQLQTLVDTSFQAVSQMYAGMGVDAAAVQQAEQGARDALAILPQLAPGLLASLGVIVAAAALALASLIFPRMGQKAALALAFHEFRLHWVLPYGFIAGLAMILVAGWLPGDGEVLRFAGINVAIFFFTLFFVQGLAVTRWIMVARGVKGGSAVALYAAVLLGQLFLQLLSWVGILDCWLDFRKRMSRTVAPVGAERQAQPGADEDEEDK